MFTNLVIYNDDILELHCLQLNLLFATQERIFQYEINKIWDIRGKTISQIWKLVRTIFLSDLCPGSYYK